MSEHSCSLCGATSPDMGPAVGQWHRRFCHSCCPPIETFATRAEYDAAYNSCMRGFAAGTRVPLPPTPLPTKHAPLPTKPAPTEPWSCALCRIHFSGRHRKFCNSCCPPHGEFATKTEYQAVYTACLRGVAAGLSVPLAARAPVKRQPPKPPKPALAFEVACKYCATAFTVLAKSRPRSGTRVCNQKCAQRHHRHGVRARRRLSTAPPPPSPPPTPPSYGEPVPCAMCGALHQRFGGQWSYCSEPCRKLAKRGREARKSFKRRTAAGQEPYTIMQIFQRDGDRCCLCGKKGIDIFDGSSFNIEHALPVSKGGLDVLSNVGLAHPLCNNQKGNGLFRGRPEQMRLRLVG